MDTLHGALDALAGHLERSGQAAVAVELRGLDVAALLSMPMGEAVPLLQALLIAVRRHTVGLAHPSSDKARSRGGVRERSAKVVDMVKRRLGAG